MEVILREDVENLGTRGQVVKVASGYARNFLLPKRMAVTATDSNKKIVEQERQAHLRKEVKVKSEAEDLSKFLNGVTVTILQKAGDDSYSENDCSFTEPRGIGVQELVEMSGEINDGPFGFLLARALGLHQRVQAS